VSVALPSLFLSKRFLNHACDRFVARCSIFASAEDPALVRNVQRNDQGENGTIMPQFQDLHQVLTNVYVDYQLLKARGRSDVQ